MNILVVTPVVATQKQTFKRVVEVTRQNKEHKMAQIRYALSLFRKGILLDF
jgi:hypothetical protein